MCKAEIIFLNYFYLNKVMNGREVWKIFFCGFVALIAAVFVYLNIKDILPIPVVISLFVFLVAYAAMTHVVKY